MPSDLIYRSADPEVLAAWDQAAQTYRDYCDRRKEQLAAWGLPGHPVYVSRSVFGNVMRGIDKQGLSVAPPGWRTERNKGYLVPSRTTKAGKKIAVEFDALVRLPDVRAALEPFGMPAHQWEGNRITAYAARRDQDEIWIRWEDVRADELDEKVDHSRWMQVKLSEYYAMVEAGNDPFTEVESTDAG